MNDGNAVPQMLTVTEVADYLRVSETTIWRWCSTGRLPAFRVGRGWRVQRSELEQHIKAQKRKNGVSTHKGA
jgi:excisionase family DNA binding protein